MCVFVFFVWKNEVIFYNEVGTKPIKTILNVLVKEKKEKIKKNVKMSKKQLKKLVKN